MSQTKSLDPHQLVRVTDAEVNANATATGREDFDQSDYLSITGNDTARKIVVAGKNDGETGDHVPLYITGTRKTVEVKTADYTVLVADSGKVFTTVGAAGTVVFALPAAVVGLEYFFKVGAAQELRIDPNGTETVALPSTGVQSAAGKYITANAAGETVHLICDTAGTWNVYGYTGTWTAEG